MDQMSYTLLRKELTEAGDDAAQIIINEFVTSPDHFTLSEEQLHTVLAVSKVVCEEMLVRFAERVGL